MTAGLRIIRATTGDHQPFELAQFLRRTEAARDLLYKVAVAYAVVAWLVVQVATQVFPFFEVPSWAVRLVVLILALGFPVALVLAWAFEITPGGIKRADEVSRDESIGHHTGRKLVAVTVVVGLIAVALFSWPFLRSKLAVTSVNPSSAAIPAPAAPEKSVAVLPFESLSSERRTLISPTASRMRS